MNKDYYRRQNTGNILIDNKNNFVSSGKKSIKNNNNLIKTTSFDGSKTIHNTEESNGFEEMIQNEEDIDHLKKFHLEKENNPFLINTNRNNSLNSNKILNFSLINSFQNKNQLLNRQISGKIPHPRKTNAIIPIDKKKLGVSFFQNKRNSSGERYPVKKLQSKYSSVSENKYNFIHRLAGNQKYGINDYSDNNIPKINCTPINASNGPLNYSNNKSTDVINNSGQKMKKYRNSNFNTIIGIYSNSNNIFKNNQKISPQNNNNDKQLDNRGNRFLKNKKSANFEYNTINGNKLQDNIQLVKIEQNINNQVQNAQYFQLKNNPSLNIVNENSKSMIATIPKTNNNYSVNNSNLVNQRLTAVGYKYLNNKNENITLYFRPFTQKDMQDPNNQIKYNPINTDKIKKEPEIAVVTKISSSKDNNLINNKNNILINNNKNSINKIYENSQDLEQILKNKNQYFNNNINNSQIYNNQIPLENQSKIIKNSSNNYLTQEEINKIFGQVSNPLINQNPNIYISPPITSNQKENKQLASNYITDTNKIFYQNNFNKQSLNQIYNMNQNSKQNYTNLYNFSESERLTVTNNNKNNINNNKPVLKNNTNIIYNNPDGKGLVKNYKGASHPGKDASGKTKTNQDSFVCKTSINNIKDFNIFGVLDGHGPDGHFVSEFASEFIPSQITNHPEIKKLSTPEKIYMKLKENNCKIINQAFLSADKQLTNMEFDVSESGCTCCLVIQVGIHLICANTGDSRAIVVYDQANEINNKNLNYLDFVPLSIDYKPELPEEISRIILAGGVVEQMKDEYGEGIGPYRVWVKGKDYPGLAMSRSIGDLKGKTIGVIPDPGILEYDLNKSTKYIIVCSDGVWEFLNNEIVMNTGKQFYLQNNPADFCSELIAKALKEWENNESIVDDITAVVVFF